MEFIDRAVVRSLWGCLFVDWKFLEADGASSDIVVPWDRRVVEKMAVAKGEYSLSCRFRCVEAWKETLSGFFLSLITPTRGLS